MSIHKKTIAPVFALVLGLSSVGVLAQNKSGPGPGEEIRIGNTAPYSGPVSALGTVSTVQAAYFKMVNDAGGINGRKVNFITLDDAYNPAKTVEQTRKLVEQDKVLLFSGSMGTGTNMAARPYLNKEGVPQLFISSGTQAFNQPDKFPWTMGLQQTSGTEAKAYANYIIKTFPDAKVAVLYQNDDYGREYLEGFRAGMGSKKSMIVDEQPYLTTDPTVDSQIALLKNSGATVFLSITTPKAAAQAIRRVAELNWKVTQFQVVTSNTVGGTLKAAGLDISKGLISVQYYKDPNDPQWKDDPAMKKWHTFMDKYYPTGDKTNGWNVFGYLFAQATEKTLQRAGNDLSRANIMKQARSLDGVVLDMLLPGITLHNSTGNQPPLSQFRLMKFNGEYWELFGPIINSNDKT